MQMELVDDVLRIERLIIRDFAAGEISYELAFEIRRTVLRLEIYCNSRWFHFRKNRKLRTAWNDFMMQFALTRSQKIKVTAGLGEKIDALLIALVES